MRTERDLRKFGSDAIIDRLKDGGMSNLNFSFYSDTDVLLCTLDLHDLVKIPLSSAYQFIGDSNTPTVTGVIAGNGVASYFIIKNILHEDVEHIIGSVGGYHDANVDFRINNTLWTTGGVLTIQNLIIDMAENSISGNT